MVCNYLRRWKNSAISMTLWGLSLTGMYCWFTSPAPAGALSEVILFSKPSSTHRYSIFSMRPDGNELTPLANIPFSCREPNLCTATNTVAFSALVDRNWNIYSVNLDTNELTCLVSSRSDARHPVWLPDGSKIIFETDRWGQSELAILDIASKTTQRLTFNQGINRYPAVSPNGTKVAYTSWVRGIANIYELTLDSANLNDIATWDKAWKLDPLVSQRHHMTKGHYACTKPRWGEDNEHVIFECQSYRAPFLSGNWQDGEAVKFLQKTCIYAKSPAWSPDGKRIVYQYIHKKEHPLKIYDVETSTVSDFPRQFDEAISDTIWQRCQRPWSLEKAAQYEP